MSDAAKADVRGRLFQTLVGCLGDGGLAERSGLTAQPGQRDYSQRWAEVIARSLQACAEGDTRPHLLMSSADTGTGKTIGYAVPALTLAAMGHRVGIATHSHALQRQMLGTAEQPGDLPMVAQWLQSLGLGPIRIARRVGMQAFVSASAIELALSDLGQDMDNPVSASLRQQIEWLHAWALESNAGLNSGLIEDAVEHFGGSLPGGLGKADVCLDAVSPAEDRVAYEAHLAAAEQANVVLMSHHYLASCALYRRAQLSERGFTALVIDEADLLADSANSVFRSTLSLRRLEHVLEAIPGVEAERAVEATRHAAAVAAQACGDEEAKAFALVGLAPRARKRLDEAVELLHAAIAAIAVKRIKDAEIAQSVADAAEFIKKMRGLDGGGLFAAALSFSPSRRFASLAMMPHNTGALLRQLWRKPEDGEGVSAVMFTSATLGTPGRAVHSVDRFREAAIALGVSTSTNDSCVVDTGLWASFEPVKFGALRFILADPSVQVPVVDVDDDLSAVLGDEWVAYAANMIRAAHVAGGRTLVLTRSYRDNAALAGALERIGVPVIAQDRELGMAPCQQRYVEDPRAIWLSPSAWEGLSLPGMVDNLVVSRLPFRGIDKVERALMEAQGRLTKTGIDRIVNARAMNAAKRLLRQGMGRAIRRRSDRSRIWIADPRFPISSKSPLPASHPEAIELGFGKTYPVLHSVVPARFERALQMAAVFLKDGNTLTP